MLKRKQTAAAGEPFSLKILHSNITNNTKPTNHTNYANDKLPLFIVHNIRTMSLFAGRKRI